MDRSWDKGDVWYIYLKIYVSLFENICKNIYRLKNI